ncbi:hypothetical protein GCM10025857_26710 [Alicyclobacillus contaminans]|nr:hypothetical protein GCM10025857_26710 [Alicyclobacillus contaminans]
MHPREERAPVIVLAWIGEILLFFIAWKVAHWGTVYVVSRQSLGLVGELVLNVVLAVLLLIAFANISSVWWLMLLVGVFVGIITGKIGVEGKEG